MKLKYIALIIILSFLNPLYAWENVLTHPRITEQAANPDFAIIDNNFKYN